MTTPAWTPEQVIALAPDASSAKAGRELAQPRKWLNPGHNGEVLWGEHQGSGNTPYQTIVELVTPAFHCSCPSRKFPCKHGLGLFLVYAQQSHAFAQTAPPVWVSEWLAGRTKRAQQKAEKSVQAQNAPEPKAEVTASQAKRAIARESKVAAGVAELQLWLADLIRGGLAQAQSQPNKYWATMAARLVDAQAPGLANRIQELSTIPASGPDWKDHLLEKLSLLHLLLEAYKRLDQLPMATQADVRSLIGFPTAQEDLLALPGLRDHWLIQGQRVSEEGNLRTQRTWLVGENSQQSALLLHFAVNGQPLDRSLVVGAVIEAELVFYPSAYPLRALIKQRFATQALTRFVATATIDSALTHYAAALALLPWLDRFPMTLQAVVPFFEAERCWISDSEQFALPLSANFSATWKLLALSGGEPLSLFGEWNGDSLLPLSALVDKKVVLL